MAKSPVNGNKSRITAKCQDRVLPSVTQNIDKTEHEVGVILKISSRKQKINLNKENRDILTIN